MVYIPKEKKTVMDRLMLELSVVERRSEANQLNGVVTFTAPIDKIAIFNKGVEDGYFNVNGIEIYVPAMSSFSDPIGGQQSNKITVTNATSYEILRYE